MALPIAILFNQPVLDASNPDSISESGVLDAVEAVENALQMLGKQAIRVPVGRDPELVIRTLRRVNPEVVFNLCEAWEGRSAGEPWVIGLLEMLGIPYTGCSVETTAIARNKALVKRLLLGSGLPTALFQLVRVHQTIPAEWIQEQLSSGPLFVKPAAEDASLGIDEESVVESLPQAEKKIASIHRLYGDAIIETFLPGREINVGVVYLPQPVVLPLAEIEFHLSADFRWPILAYDAKWLVDSPADLATTPRCPIELEDSTRHKICDLALKAARLVDGRDYLRVDFRLTPDHQPWILEINPNPDLSPYAGIARGLRVAQIRFEDFVAQILNNAQLRSRSAEVIGGIKDVNEIEGDFLLHQDRTPIINLLHATAVFRPDEITIAEELINDSLDRGELSDYKHIVLRRQQHVVGWACYGLTALTDGVYDLYWIAVHPAHQRLGLGRELLAKVAAHAWRNGGRWLIAETSTLDVYEKTREFYMRNKFQLVSQLDDFYRRGDGRAVYAKRLDGGESNC